MFLPMMLASDGLMSKKVFENSLALLPVPLSVLVSGRGTGKGHGQMFSNTF